MNDDRVKPVAFMRLVRHGVIRTSSWMEDSIGARGPYCQPRNRAWSVPDDYVLAMGAILTVRSLSPCLRLEHSTELIVAAFKNQFCAAACTQA